MVHVHGARGGAGDVAFGCVALERLVVVPIDVGKQRAPACLPPQRIGAVGSGVQEQ